MTEEDKISVIDDKEELKEREPSNNHKDNVQKGPLHKARKQATPAFRYYKEGIKLVGKFVWPVFFIYLTITFKSNIIKLIDVVSFKIEKSGPVKNFSIDKGKVSMEFEVNNRVESKEIHKGKLEIEKPAKAMFNALSSGHIDKELIDNKNIATLNNMAKNYLEVTNNISDYSDKINKKANLARQMGVFIVKNSVPKYRLINISNEGIYIGLIYSIILSPSKNDIDIILKIYPNIYQQFTMYSILSAIGVLIDNKYLVADNFSIVNKIINHISAQNPDASLIDKLDEIKLKIGRRDANVILPSIGVRMQPGNITVK